MASGQAAGGLVNHAYDIPEVTIRSPRAATWLILVAGIGIGLARHAHFYLVFPHDRILMGTLTALFILTLAQWVMSMFERPYQVTPAQQEHLGRLQVTVNIPVYNEDPALLDRALYAMFAQTRLPGRVEVVDDGSTTDYTALRDYWARNCPAGVAFSWIRQENRGKKRAQARTFGRYGDADIFVTLDSDTALERRALEEGLKPFARRRVQSVAGLELAFNHGKNWLTRLQSSRTVIWQLLSCSAQSVLGDVLVNRGTFALYRAPVIRDNLRAYLEETFFGHPVDLGDDAALTLFARGRGLAVQQPTAVQFAMYPETLSHQVRQWTRWMRGSTIRTFWRIRYLPLRSYGWWFTVLSLWAYVVGLATVTLCLALWPGSRFFVETMFLASIAWSYGLAIRVLAVVRSDQGWRTRIGSFLIAPVVTAWSVAVLRPLRLYGIATCLQQGWVTRSLVEVGPRAEVRLQAERLKRIEEELG
jgi:hyaluronan synthase